MTILTKIWTSSPPVRKPELYHLEFWKTVEVNGVALYTAPTYYAEDDGRQVAGIVYAYATEDGMCGGFGAPEVKGEPNAVSLEAFDIAVGEVLLMTAQEKMAAAFPVTLPKHQSGRPAYLN